MNGALLLAAILAGAVGVAHSYLGERYLIVPLHRRTDLPSLLGSAESTKRILRFAWHLTSIAWWGLGAALFTYALAPAGPSARTSVTIIAATFLVSAVVSFVGGRGRHLSWLVFLAIAAAAWYGVQ